MIISRYYQACQGSAVLRSKKPTMIDLVVVLVLLFVLFNSPWFLSFLFEKISGNSKTSETLIYLLFGGSIISVIMVYRILREKFLIIPQDCEDNQKPSIPSSIAAYASCWLFFSLVTMAFSMVLNVLPFSHVGLGMVDRRNDVQHFIRSVDTANGHLPEQINRTEFYKDPDTLLASYRVRNRSIYGEEYRRAMMSMALIGMGKTDQYARLKKQGWISKSEFRELGQMLKENPPQLDTPLKGQAYLRLVGEVPLNYPLTDPGKKTD